MRCRLWTKNAPILTELREILYLFSNLLINDVKCEENLQMNPNLTSVKWRKVCGFGQWRVSALLLSSPLLSPLADRSHLVPAATPFLAVLLILTFSPSHHPLLL